MIPAMKAIVTGANGHIGSRIVRLLVEGGHNVRAMVRAGSDRRSLAGIEGKIEVRVGDLLDRDSLRGAMEGRTHLFHTATRFSHSPDEAEEIWGTAVEGTENVLRAAASAGSLERIVHTSSCATVGSSPKSDEIRDESSIAGDEMEIYRRAKIAGERAALKIARELGLPLVVVNPAVVLGPGDFRPTPSNRVVLRALAGGSRAYWSGGRSHVDVEDVARGHLLAAERGREGERYILGGENITIRRAGEILAKLTGTPFPVLKLGRGTMWVLGLGLEAFGRLRASPPRATRAQASAACGRYMYYSSEKAERELGYSARSAEEVFVRAVAWFLCNEIAVMRGRARARAFFEAVVGDPPEAALAPSFYLSGIAPFRS